MRKDRRHQFGLGAFERARDRIALNQFRDFGTNHMRADQLAGPGIEHRLHQALGFAERDGLAVALEREAADLDLVPLGLGRSLRQTDRGDLRLAISAARYIERI